MRYVVVSPILVPLGVPPLDDADATAVESDAREDTSLQVAALAIPE